MIRMQTFPKQGKCLGSQAPDCYHFNAPPSVGAAAHDGSFHLIFLSHSYSIKLAAETAVWFVPLGILNYCALKSKSYVFSYWKDVNGCIPHREV